MTPDLERAVALLSKGNTCVLVRGEQTLVSTRRGVAPLLAWLNDGENYRDFSAADKVVGRAAAFLYVLLGVRAVYADTLSDSAEQIFARYRIPVFYQQKTAVVYNRTHTDLCPMEKATQAIDDPLAAKIVIEQTLQTLRSVNH